MSGIKKRSRRRVSLFAKYISFFISVELICLIAFGIALGVLVTDTWEDEQKQKLYDYTANIADVYQEYVNSEHSLGNISSSQLCYNIASVASASKSDIYITDKSGNVVFCKHMHNTQDAQTGVITCEIHSAMQIPGEITTGILSQGLIATRGNLGGALEEESFIAASVSKRSLTSEADGIVFAVQPLNVGLEPYRATYVQIYIPSAIAFIAIIILIGYIVTYKMISPLREMSEATKKYSVGDFSYRIKNTKKSTVKEFYELTAAINSMAENLERLENSRSDFVANVSHELKTPMTTIGGFIDGILDGTISGENQNYYLQIVSDEIKRLSRLVVSMLNMSKMASGELQINLSNFNLTKQIVGIFIALEQKINDKQLNINGLDSLSNICIEADADMINQVFYNLIDNAVKFTETGGNIGISMFIKGEEVIVEIINTGKGIEEEDITHVFDRFYKGDKSRSLDAKSAGLGLFIVKNIVELHNGEITVSSKYNEYTRFAVRLPIDATWRNKNG